MAGSSSNTAVETTVPFLYQGCIGRPTTDGGVYPFNFPERAPSSLCQRFPCGAPDPNPDATGQFLTTLVERHNTRFLFSRAWRCQICNKRARELYHSAIARLVREEFLPWVRDTIIPICRSGGACDVKAGEWAAAFGKESLPLLDVGTKCCELCGKVTSVKLCRGCKVLAYV